MIVIDILTGILSLTLGALIINVAMTHRAPSGPLSRFLGIHRMMNPPLGYLFGAMITAFGLFMIVQSIRLLLGHI
jgi:hypothetical protein